MPEPIFQFEQKAGDPFLVGGVKIVPFAQSLHIRNPFWRLSGLVWNRPSSVMVVSADGQEQVLPVHDVTRWIQLSLLAAGFGSSLLIWLLFRIFQIEKQEEIS
jgi:hypothetical protein